MSTKEQHPDNASVETDAVDDLRKQAAEEAAGADTATAETPGTDQPGDAAGGDEAAEGTEFLQERVSQLEEENSELKDKYLRKHADFENFRKRMLREKEDFAKYANQQLLGDLVSVIDDFERAIGSAAESQDFQSFYDGIAMIEKQLVSTLESKYGLQRFDSRGEDFDPQRHEAVASVPADEGQDAAKVEEVFQKGYMLHDRVLRSAKVKVSLP